MKFEVVSFLERLLIGYGNWKIVVVMLFEKFVWCKYVIYIYFLFNKVGWINGS